jgi:hypothetical protein
VPVSRDGLIIRRKTIFGGLFDNIKTTSISGDPRTLKSARQIAESTPKFSGNGGGTKASQFLDREKTITNNDQF